MRKVRRTEKRWKVLGILATIGMVAAVLVCGFFAFRSLAFPMPYKRETEGCGVEPALIFAVMKAESGFRERAKSEAGAMGLMQLMPATAEFICERSGTEFSKERLFEGGYNVKLGGMYLGYLLERFECEETAIAAYNAGEGTVSKWLKDGKYSRDGTKLKRIPYPETRDYVKKVKKYRKIYRILYH